MNLRTHLRAAGLSIASAAVAVGALTASVPASAVAVTDASQSVTSATSLQAQESGHYRWRYYDTYDHYRDCYRHGEWGQDHRGWDDYECRRVRDRDHDHDHDRDHHDDYNYELWYRR